jgi:GAF domain-containing protein
VAILPLWVGGRQLGVLMMVGEVPYHFTENEVRPYRSLAGQMAILVENQRLLQQAQQRATRLEWLALMESTLSLANDEDGILTAISMAVDLEHPVSKILMRYVDTDQDGRPVALRTVASWYDGLISPDDPALGQRFSVQEDALADLWLQAPNATLFIEDVESDPRVDRRMRAQVVEQGFQALALMPLYAGNLWRGLVTFLWETPHTFSPEERYHLHELSKPASAAVTNRQAYVAQQQAREVSERRALRLETAAEVSRVVNSILEPKALLQRVVDLVRERFELYYVGLFLVDQQGAWAVLRAGTGEAGQQMVDQGHKLRVGGESMIGACVAGAEARIAFDVGEEAVRFDNPFLPETRSEMALPLIARGEAMGAMTIQSTQPSAFSDEDITVLQTMADQVAIAIDNARLLEQTQRRAERERQVRTITDRVRRAPDREMILRAALQELGQMLGASESVIQLGTRDQLLERASTREAKGN